MRAATAASRSSIANRSFPRTTLVIVRVAHVAPNGSLGADVARGVEFSRVVRSFAFACHAGQLAIRRTRDARLVRSAALSGPSARTIVRPAAPSRFRVRAPCGERSLHTRPPLHALSSPHSAPGASTTQPPRRRRSSGCRPPWPLGFGVIPAVGPRRERRSAGARGLRPRELVSEAEIHSRQSMRPPRLQWNMRVRSKRSSVVPLVPVRG